MSTVLITGASRGIGRATALALERRGWTVWAGVRTDDAARDLRREGSERLRPVVLDVTDAASVRAVGEAIGDAPLDGVVNSAGIALAGVLEAVDPDDLRRQLDVNLIGPVAVTQAVLPALRRGGGRVILVSSVNGRLALPFLGGYSASKFALEAVGDTLRLELRPWRLPVVLIEPSAIDTDMWRGAEEDVEATIAAMTDEQRRLYAGTLEAARRTTRRMAKSAAPVATVVRTICEALTTARPRPRYLVGRDAKGTPLLEALPDRARDALLTRVMGLE